MEQNLHGFHRAKVVDNKDPEYYGRVIVWIPDIMLENISEDTGIWARPANNPIGGRNSKDDSDQRYMGSSYIPRKGSWVWIFFEAGNINRPYYFAGLDIEHSKTLPENQVGSNYEDKWVIFKSNHGRTIAISDDPDDARVEITGKKRQLEGSEDPSGDTESVYTIDDNQTTILLDERTGKEKILIRTYKGDYLHIDVDEQQLHIEFESDINIKTGGDLNITVAGDINEKSKNAFRHATNETHIKSLSIIEEAESEIHRKSAVIKDEATGAVSVKAGANYDLTASAINTDASIRTDQSGAASPASADSAQEANPSNPSGERDT